MRNGNPARNALMGVRVKESERRSLAARLLDKDLYDWIVLLGSVWPRLKSRLYYPIFFGAFGKTSLMFRPCCIGKPKYIHIGEHVLIRQGARLEAVVLKSSSRPELRIGNNVNIEQNAHIVCHHRVILENNVSVTANCAIVDLTHPFDDLPIGAKVGAAIQDDEGFVEIGEGTVLGFGCVVLPNVRIGRGCVIGANSVVTRSVPDYSVAAGAPAVVLRSIRKV